MTNTFVYSVLHFVPALDSGEQVVLGFIVGGDYEYAGSDWEARWQPERAEILGCNVKKQLSEFLDDLAPISTMRLIYAASRLSQPFIMTQPRYLTAENLYEAVERLAKVHFRTNEEYAERWNQ